MERRRERRAGAAGGGEAGELSSGQRDARERFAEIDLLKGCAILWVLLIHSKALDAQSPAFLYLVNRAVPLFIVLFGLNSSLWWRRRRLPGDLAQWYRSRLRRIAVPYWAALPLWWALVLWYEPFWVVPAPWLPLAHLAGWTLYIGTGWFVTLILLLVALYPALEAAARRVGLWPVLGLAALGELAVVRFHEALVDRIGLLGYIAFPPRLLAHAAFGMLLATRIARLGPAAGLAAAAAWALCVLVQQPGLWPATAPYVETVIDFPLAVALLVALRPLASVPLLGRALIWLGLGSWGVYLGQMLVHDSVIFRCGFDADLAPNLAACRFPLATTPGLEGEARWLYTGVLLAGALALVAAGNLLRASYEALRRAGAPLPDVAP